MLKPSFFADADVGSVSRDSRLAFGGIWTESDDQGYFEWKPVELAWQLFRYDADKLEVMDRALDELARARLIEQLACGRHGLIDSMPEHRIQGGKHSSNYERQHQLSCGSGPIRTGKDRAEDAPGPDRSRQVRTHTDTQPESPRVRTDPDGSASVSESDSESLKGRREKNVLEEGVEIRDEAREPATPAEPAPHLTHPPVVDGRGDASAVSAKPAPAVTVPPRLAALTPKWPNGTCRDYVGHQGPAIFIRDGAAYCSICDAERAAEAAAAAAKPNGVDHATAQELGL